MTRGIFMYALTSMPIQKKLPTIFALLMPSLAVFAVACGSSESEDELFPQISDPGRVFSLDELIATPYKEVSNYSAEGLPRASDPLCFGREIANSHQKKGSHRKMRPF